MTGEETSSAVEAPERCIWTGFEPFGDHTYNPSWDVARAASEILSGYCESRAVRLSVVYESVRNWARQRTWSSGEWIVQVGLAESRERLHLEKVARNSRGDRSDEAGAALDRSDRLITEGPERISTAFDVEVLRESLERRCDGAESLPEVAVSRDAGEFVCNALYYHSLRAARAGERSGGDVLFVHVPPLEPDEAERVGREVGAGLAALFDGTD